MKESESEIRTALRLHLAELSDRSEALWQEYLEKGPGRFPADAFAAVAALLENMRRQLERLSSSTYLSSDWVTALHHAMEELDQLLRKSVQRDEGLCFITGEAGLIPRRDLYERCEAALRQLRVLNQQLDS